MRFETYGMITNIRFIKKNGLLETIEEIDKIHMLMIKRK